MRIFIDFSLHIFITFTLLAPPNNKEWRGSVNYEEEQNYNYQYSTKLFVNKEEAEAVFTAAVWPESAVLQI